MDPVTVMIGAVVLASGAVAVAAGTWGVAVVARRKLPSPEVGLGQRPTDLPWIIRWDGDVGSFEVGELSARLEVTTHSYRVLVQGLPKQLLLAGPDAARRWVHRHQHPERVRADEVSIAYGARLSEPQVLTFLERGQSTQMRVAGGIFTCVVSRRADPRLLRMGIEAAFVLSQPQDEMAWFVDRLGPARVLAPQVASMLARELHGIAPDEAKRLAEHVGTLRNDHLDFVVARWRGDEDAEQLSARQLVATATRSSVFQELAGAHGGLLADRIEATQDPTMVARCLVALHGHTEADFTLRAMKRVCDEEHEDWGDAARAALRLVAAHGDERCERAVLALGTRHGRATHALVAEALERVGSAQSLSLLKSWALSEDPRDKLSVVWRADRAIEAIIRRDALELGGALSAPKDGERVGQLSNSEGVGQLSTTDDP